jgi:hypothetical protein
MNNPNNMTRSQLTSLPVYFDRYINMTDDVTVVDALEKSLVELENMPIQTWEKLGDKVYAANKWTVKDILQHLIDCERVFAYRATAFVRGQQEVLSFDEDLFAKNAMANERTLENLLEESIALRKSNILLFKSFNDDMLQREGQGIKGLYSVAAVGFIIAGHQRWHNKILEERYYPLI